MQYIVGRAAACASIEGSVRPHTVRHSCGYDLANRGHDTRMIQDCPGHRDPRHSAHCTRTASVRFEGVW
jgi:site-specific recombinase XerD